MTPSGRGGIVALGQHACLFREIPFKVVKPWPNHGAHVLEEVNVGATKKVGRDGKAPGSSCAAVSAQSMLARVSSVDVSWWAEHEQVEAHSSCCSF